MAKCEEEKERKFRIRNSEAAAAVIFHTYVWDFNNLLCFNCWCFEYDKVRQYKKKLQKENTENKMKKILEKNYLSFLLIQEVLLWRTA